MAEEAKNTPVGEVKPAAQVEQKQTVDQMMNREEAKKPETVPLSTFVELKKELKDLRKQISDGATKKETSASIADLRVKAEAAGADPDFVESIVAAARADAANEIDARLDERLKPLADAQRADQIDKVFKENFTLAIKELGDGYKGVVNPEIIKQLSLRKENGNKTFVQIIQEVYGDLAKTGGKKTLEESQARASDFKNGIDHERVQTDPEYAKLVLADPVAKAEHNKWILPQLSKYI